ncbi:MAG: hypothetical protein C4289_15200 [Chloroflexota bacterium]
MAEHAERRERSKELTLDEAAALLQVPPETVRQWLEEGRLYGKKLAGNEWRVAEHTIDEFLHEQAGMPPQGRREPPGQVGAKHPHKHE